MPVHRNFGLGPIALSAGRVLCALDAALDGVASARVDTAAVRALDRRRVDLAHSPWRLLDRAVLGHLVDELWAAHESLPDQDWLFRLDGPADALSDAYHSVADMIRTADAVLAAAEAA